MHLYTGSTFVCRPLCGPVDEQVYQLHRKATVDVWDAWVFFVEDHGSIGGRLNIVGNVGKSLGWRKKVDSIDETGDEIEEESTGDVVEADVFEAVVLKKEEMGDGETTDVTDATLDDVTDTTVGDADDEEMGNNEDVVATVGRVNVEEVEETGKGSEESRS